jgi:hypothetical protein
MKRSNTTLIVAVLGLCGLAAYIAYPALAHCGKCAADAKKIAQSLLSGKVTLAKAIEAAETHSKGKAISVTPAMDDAGKLTLQVFSVVGDKIQRCDVDGQTGAVGKSEAVDTFPISEKDHAHDHGPDGKSSAANITNKSIELGCAQCVFHMAGADGCELAANVDGKTYMVKGNHGQNAHHFCEAGKPATVTGMIDGDTLIVTSVKVGG